MSTAGIYNYRPKVDNPNAIFSQMDSDTARPPFFFGGSQVPVNLNIMHGSGLRTNYTTTDERVQNLQMKGNGLGVGLKTLSHKNDNIKLNKYYKRL
jgi:hypothetical protein